MDDTAASSASVVNNSSAMEQQTQPSPISTNSAAPCIFGPSVSSRSSLLAVILASMFTAAMSLTTTPTLESLSWEASSSKLRSSVVLPVPKNPDKSVTGTLLPGSATVGRRAPSELARRLRLGLRLCRRGGAWRFLCSARLYAPICAYAPRLRLVCAVCASFLCCLNRLNKISAKRTRGGVRYRLTKLGGARCECAKSSANVVRRAFPQPRGAASQG